MCLRGSSNGRKIRDLLSKSSTMEYHYPYNFFDQFSGITLHDVLDSGTKRTELRTVYPFNLQYTPCKQLYDRLPKLPAAVYHLLLGNDNKSNLQRYKDLCQAIQAVKWNLLIKPRMRDILERIYKSSVERHNIKRIFDEITIFGSVLTSDIREVYFAFKNDTRIFYVDKFGLHAENKFKL